MTDFLDAIITRFANLISTLTLLAVFLVFNFVVFPSFMPEDASVKPLDLQYLYTAQEAYNTLDQMSQPERRTYLIAECTADAIYPIVYTLLFAFALYLLYGNLTLAKLPFAILLADYVENLGIIQLLRKYPEQLTVLANFTGFVSAVKWFFALIVVLITLVGGFRALRKMMFKD